MSVTDNEMLALLTKGMETVYLNAAYKNASYQIPACRKSPNENYRVSHSTLLYFYRKLKRQFNDVRIVMHPEWKYYSLGYSVAACSVVTKDGESDLYFGENRVTTFSARVDADNPFQIAVNRAMDKAIYYEIFGLPSRYFDSDGFPVLSSDSDDMVQPASEAQNDKEVSSDAAVQQPSAPAQPQQPSQPAKQAQEKAAQEKLAGQNPGKDPGNGERQEFDELSVYEVKVRKEGKECLVPLKDLSDKVLRYLVDNCTPEYEESKKKMVRYLELKKKLKAA